MEEINLDAILAGKRSAGVTWQDKHKNSAKIWLYKQEEMSPEDQKQGYQSPYKSTYVLQFFKKKNLDNKI